ncbi:hypothetical protein [Plantactinospora sp. B24E8]|uniref:hypothetical protein n=1 Tax=Plantactinospora sp. B24E8 TaxID=3153567 RepID=UPI00325E6EFE
MNDTYAESRTNLLASCSWKNDGDDGPHLMATVRIFRRAGDLDVEELALNALRKARDEAEKRASEDPEYYQPPADLPGLGDGAYLTLDPVSMAIEVKTRSENALVTTTLWLTGVSTYDTERRREVLRAQQSNIIAATRDVLDDLR